MTQRDDKRTETPPSNAVAAIKCIKGRIRPNELRVCPCDDCYLEREAAAERRGGGSWEPHEIALLSDRQRAKLLRP